MNIRQKIRHIRRYRQITRVFLKHGLGYLIHRMGMEKYVPIPTLYSLQKCEREPDNCLADKLTHAFMELGPTFVKLGQVLSTRADILSPGFIAELERLQDKVSPVPIEQIKEQIAREIGPVDQIFADFNPVPLAAASIGQVHRATLKTGEQVIIKVQRPNIEALVENDLEIFINLARIMEKRSPEAARIGILDIVEDYGRMIRLELDYDREAKNAERMRHNFAKDSSVVIPRVFWDYTTTRVLTEEYIEGVKLSDLTTIEVRGWSRNKISQLGTQAFLTQVMVHGSARRRSSTTSTRSFTMAALFFVPAATVSELVAICEEKSPIVSTIPEISELILVNCSMEAETSSILLLVCSISAAMDKKESKVV